MQSTPDTPPSSGSPQGDPWHAVGYLTSGVFLYGAVGWGLDRWLGTGFLVVIGILFGAGLGLYMTWKRFFPQQDPPQHPEHSDTGHNETQA